MVTVYCPEELALLEGLGNPHSYCPRVRAATSSVLLHTVMNHLTSLLEKDGTLGTKSHLRAVPTIERLFKGLIKSHIHVRFIQERRDALPGLLGSFGTEWTRLQRRRV